MLLIIDYSQGTPKIKLSMKHTQPPYYSYLIVKLNPNRLHLVINAPNPPDLDPQENFYLYNAVMYLLKKCPDSILPFIEYVWSQQPNEIVTVANEIAMDLFEEDDEIEVDCSKLRIVPVTNFHSFADEVLKILKKYMPIKGVHTEYSLNLPSYTEYYKSVEPAKEEEKLSKEDMKILSALKSRQVS